MRPIKVKETVFGEDGRKQSESERVVEAVEEKYCPPSATAAAYLLKILGRQCAEKQETSVQIVHHLARPEGESGAV